MDAKYQNLLLFCISFFAISVNALGADSIQVWRMKEIQLKAAGNYENCYKDVTCRVELKGPNFPDNQNPTAND